MEWNKRYGVMWREPVTGELCLTRCVTLGQAKRLLEQLREEYPEDDCQAEVFLRLDERKA